MKLLLLSILVFTNLLFSDAFSLAKTIADKKFSLTYFYWFDKEDKVYYLSKEKADQTYSVWSFTEDRKWKPHHNAGRFDGFPEAGSTLESAFRQEGVMQIKKEQCRDDNSNQNTCKETSYPISHYFWLDNTGLAFLLKNNDNDNDISIWRFTQDKKWQPVHNAKAFDGFPKAGKNISKIELDIRKANVLIGKAVNEISKNFNLSLESANLGNNNSLTATFLDLSPELSWNFNSKYKDEVSNFVYQIMSDDGQMIYSTVIEADKKSVKVSRGSIYNGILPRVSFCETSFKKYEKPKNDNSEGNASEGNELKAEDEGGSNSDKTIAYNMSLYSISKTSHLLNDVDCVNLVSMPDYHIVKKTIKSTLFTDRTVQVNGQIDESTDEDKRGVFLGEVIFTFFPTNINRLPKDYSKYITIENVPPGAIPVFKDIGDDKIKLYFTGIATTHEGSSAKIKVTFHKDMFIAKLDRDQYSYFTMTFSHECGQ